MRQSIKIGTTEIGHLVKENGISVTEILRSQKEITTLNGTLYRKGKTKHQINISFLDLYDKDYRTLMNNLSVGTNATQVTIANMKTGTNLTGLYYVTDNGYTAKKSIGDLTYVTNASIILEER